MLDVLKMDLRRIFHSKMFYICLLSMLFVTGSMVIFGVAPDFASIMGAGVEGTEDAMMGNMMGIGMAFMVIGIFSSLFICQEFTSGFAKNIFARHTNPMRYIGGKLLSLAASGATMILAFVVVSAILIAITGGSIALSGGLIGLLALVAGKLLSVATLTSVIIFVCLFTRKSVVGIMTGIAVSVGAIPILLNIAGDTLGLFWIAGIMRYTISGLLNLSALTFNVSTLAIVIIGNLMWTVLFAGLSSHTVKIKDI